MKTADFKVLTFDCYGTLIDWESGLLTALAPLRAKLSTPLTDDAVLQAFSRQESRQQALTPAMAYADLLAAVHGQLTASWGIPSDAAANERFGGSVGDWPAFPDTAEALRYLKRHFCLVILSNVDRASFQASNRRLKVVFDAIYTAQDIGSYKPSPRNFVYLLDRLAADGFARETVLHVAQSLFHDHAPANAVGLASAWIDRRHAVGGWGATAPVAGNVRYDFRFTGLGALAAAHAAGG
ncbi:haloacid dehalogenase type II [Rhodopila sp.]|uniref:haloacid dehalogenase type II n=1 Tax=Rhodopila sp. TaxID=2480087 RepID=UPI003D0E111B